jgi:hypothetical protein
MITKRTFYGLWVSILVTGLGAAGCQSRPAFTKPIAKFQEGASAVIEVSRLHITEMNRVERDAYIERQVQQKKPIKLDEMEATRVLSSADLDARLKALKAVADYGELLARLANSDAPARVEAEAKELGESVTALGTTINGLTGTENDAFKEKAGAITGIFAAVAKAVVEKKIDAAIRRAVEAGDQPVRNLLKTLGDDLSIAYERRRALISNQRVSAVRRYNDLLQQNAPAADVRAAADAVSAQETAYELFPATNPTIPLEGMAEAHSALVEYARKEPSIDSLVSLADAMELFAARAKLAADAFNTLRK